MPFFGTPLRLRPQSAVSTLIVEPTLGLDLTQPSVDAPLGSTPNSDNYIMREGGLEPRPMLSVRGTNEAPFGNLRILGGAEVVDVDATRYPLVSGTTRWAWYSNDSWSVLSYVSSFGVDVAPAGGTNDYWDFAQIYLPAPANGNDANIAIGANGSGQSLYVWQSNTTVFSTLTGAPRARYVAAFDNYVLAANIDEGNDQLVQRVQWSDRGSASSWTGGLSGFEDLLAAKGEITRLLPLESRIVVLMEDELWQGFPVQFPFIFRFQPLDATIGCPYPWTATVTPRGIIFLGKDYQTYLIPKEGGNALPVGQRLHRRIRQNIDQPQRAWGVYDSTFNQYQLYYPIKGGSGLPQRATFLNLNEGSWAPQSFDRTGGGLSLTRGFEAQLSSSATTWGGLQAAGLRWADLGMSWGELAGASEERSVHIGSSAGTMYYLNSNATDDDGTAVRSFWESSALDGFAPEAQKTVTRIRLDYQSESASSLTVRISQNQGQSFVAGERVALPTTSAISQTDAYPYIAARYPMIRVESENNRYRLFRFHIEMKRGGR